MNINNNNKSYSSTLYNWNLIPYPGNRFAPQPEEKLCYSWPLIFFKKDNNLFFNKKNELVPFQIKEPDLSINFHEEFLDLVSIQYNLTEYQVKLAKYWGFGPPSKQFTPIADILITTYNLSACRASRLLYILHSALNDASVICWHYKYTFNVIRPCQYNTNFETIIPTPNHPSYPAGHSVQAGCMAEILSYFFPAERNKLFRLAMDCSNSRIYAGVHYMSDCSEGIKLGVNIAKEIIKVIQQDYNENSSSVDYIFTEFKDANIIPDLSTQYIK